MIQKLTVLITEIITTYKFLLFFFTSFSYFLSPHSIHRLKNKLNKLLDQNKNCHGCEISHAVSPYFTIQSFVF